MDKRIQLACALKQRVQVTMYFGEETSWACSKQTTAERNAAIFKGRATHGSCIYIHNNRTSDLQKKKFIHKTYIYNYIYTGIYIISKFLLIHIHACKLQQLMSSCVHACMLSSGGLIWKSRWISHACFPRSHMLTTCWILPDCMHAEL